MKKTTFFLSIIAITISVITIILFFCKVSPNSVVDSNTFISTLVGIFSLAITLLIGYQIYNAFEAREKMDGMKNEVDKKLYEIQIVKDELSQARNDLEELKNEFKQGGYILQARLYAGKALEHHLAFLQMLLAIKASLDLDNKEDGYGWILNELKEYMLLINNTYPFGGTPNEVAHKVQLYKDYYKKNDEEIRNHKNYYIIRDMYEPLMSEFEKRLNGIAQMKPMSYTEVGEYFKTE